MDHIKSVGIIGQGSFGKFFGQLFPSSTTILGYDEKVKSRTSNVQRATFDEVAHADVVILAVPLQAYPKVLERLSQELQPETLVMDVCSVKVRPRELLRAYLPNHPNLLVTHPLFGPQSAAQSTRGHQLIVTHHIGTKSKVMLHYCQTVLDLEIIKMPDREHDEIMADIHALTFFVARGLSNLKLEDHPFSTPSYQMILDLVTFDHSHSQQLFETIEQGNSYSEHVRDRLVKTFTDLANELKKNDILGSRHDTP